MTTDVAHGALSRRIQDVNGRYAFRFANKARITRDLTELDRLIDQMSALHAEAAGHGVQMQDLATKAAAQVALFKKERAAIASAREAGPGEIRAAELAERVELVAARYARHFAGKSRASRDLALLDALSDALQTHAVALAALADAGVERAQRALEACQRRVTVYEDERDLIRAAQDGLPLAALKRRASEQLASYKLLYAGESRLTVRAAYLERVVERLTQLRLAQARRAVAEDDDADLTAMTEQILGFEREIEAIRATHQRATPEALRKAARAAVDALNARYAAEFAGQARATRDHEALSGLCDRLAELEMLLSELHGADDGTTSVVVLFARDALAMFEREYTLIRDARIH